MSMSRWNVAGALHKPNDITLNSKRPRCVVNAVFSLLFAFTSTCQYPLKRSKTHTAPYHPQSDGLVERLNRTILSTLATSIDESGGE